MRVDLKELLTNLHDEDIGALSEDELGGLVYEMLEQLGATDPFLRDALIYPTLADIISGIFLTPDTYRDILQVCLDERHLFYKLGEKDGDGVFMRSFSSLIIAEILRVDNNLAFLHRSDFKNLFDKMIWYMSAEVDVRGYVEEKGWAHAIAHAADVLQCLVMHPHFSGAKFADILGVIENCLFKPGLLADDEDTRLVFVVRAMMVQGLRSPAITQWINGVCERMADAFEKEGYTRQNYINIKNLSGFLKSLYFIIRLDGGNLAFRAVLSESIKDMHMLQYKASL